MVILFLLIFLKFEIILIIMEEGFLINLGFFFVVFLSMM